MIHPNSKPSPLLMQNVIAECFSLSLQQISIALHASLDGGGHWVKSFGYRFGPKKPMISWTSGINLSILERLVIVTHTNFTETDPTTLELWTHNMFCMFCKMLAKWIDMHFPPSKHVWGLNDSYQSTQDWRVARCRKCYKYLLGYDIIFAIPNQAYSLQSSNTSCL